MRTGSCLPLDVVLPLVEAVTEGRVVTRRLSSAATGLPLAISTLIRLADGSVIVQPPSSDHAIADDGAIECNTHYLPYRKPDVHTAVSRGITTTATR